MRTRIHVFLPSFLEIHKGEVIKTMQCIPRRQKSCQYFAFSPLAPLKRPRRKRSGSLFPYSQSGYQVSSKSIQFSESLTRKCLLRSVQCRRKSCTCLTTKRAQFVDTRQTVCSKHTDHIILRLRPIYSRNGCDRHTAPQEEYTGESETNPHISRTYHGTHDYLNK